MLALIARVAMEYSIIGARVCRPILDDVQKNYDVKNVNISIIN